jgi:cell division topological specificity factor
MSLVDIIARIIKREEPSKEKAKKRLKLVLMQDRAVLAPEILGLIKDEVIGVISKYVDVEGEGTELSIESIGDAYALIASIPIREVKRAVVKEAMMRARRGQ